MPKATASSSSVFLFIGFDLGDRASHAVAIDHEGKRVRSQQLRTTTKSLETWFGPKGRLTEGRRCRIMLEAGTHSAWVEEVLREYGHETIVANPRKMVRTGGGRRRRKNDRIDAEELARIGRLDPELLAPIRHRGKEARLDLSTIRARAAAVECRTALVSSVRAKMKTHGYRLLNCSTEAFHKRAAAQIPEELEDTLLPLLELIEKTTEVIRGYDRKIQALTTSKYPEAQHLTQVPGVGALTALAYVLTLEDHRHFRRSRSAGAFLGLVPHQHQSGDKDPQLRITKTGDVMMRRLLVTAAHYILGPMNKVDSDLRRFGTRLVERGGAAAKKKAIIAVARKLASVLHALWRSRADYVPLKELNANPAIV